MDVKPPIITVDPCVPNQSSIPRQPDHGSCETKSLSRSQTRIPLKRECLLEDYLQAKRIRKAEEELPIKPEPAHSAVGGDSDSSPSDYDFDAVLDEVIALGQAKPQSSLAAALQSATEPTIPPQAAPTPVLQSIHGQPVRDMSGANFIIAKMYQIFDLGLRTTGCRKELQRIAEDITTIRDDIGDLVKTGKSKWVVDRLVTLGEETQAVTAILDQIIRRQAAKQRKIEMQRKEKQENMRLLELRRKWNKRKVRTEGGRTVVHLDMTSPVIVKLEPGTIPESDISLDAKVEPEAVP